MPSLADLCKPKKKPEKGLVIRPPKRVDWYFCLQEDRQVVFSREHVGQEIGRVKLKDKTIISWCTSIQDSEPFVGSELFPSSVTNIPLLKSHLQKCVRRCLVDKAVSTAYNLLQLNVGELLRRLAIIIVEDGILNNEFGYLIWLMGAVSKGWELDQYSADWILEYVNWIAGFEWRHYLDSWNKDVNLTWKTLPESEHMDLLRLLQIRKDFGGMEVDITMLNAYQWEFIEGPIELLEVQHVQLSEINDLAWEDVELSAVDFHCTPILAHLSKKHNHDILEMKRAMWHWRSGYNIKKEIRTGEMVIKHEKMAACKSIWDDIHEDSETWCAYYLDMQRTNNYKS